ncbi:cyclin dependent kinase [Haematococcus lacustris]
MARQIQEKYEVLSKAGEGTYGVVYKAVSRADPSHLVAIKEMRHDEQEEGVPSSALREISLLLDLDHTNVVRLFEVFNDLRQHRLYLVFEFLDVDLYRLMQANPVAFRTDPRLVKYYTWQILQGLHYLHKRRVLHRDLKPQNLLISRRGNTLKLADFGLARAMGVPVRYLSPEVVTIWYRAPELLMGSKVYTAAVDIWSVGCIFAELTSIKPLLPGLKEIDQLNRIFQLCGTPSEADWPGVSSMAGARAAATLPYHRGHDLAQLLPNMPPDGLHLLRSMLTLDPSQRITTQAALSHPYFTDIGVILADPPRLG